MCFQLHHLSIDVVYEYILVLVYNFFLLYSNADKKNFK